MTIHGILMGHIYIHPKMAIYHIYIYIWLYDKVVTISCLEYWIFMASDGISSIVKPSITEDTMGKYYWE